MEAVQGAQVNQEQQALTAAFWAGMAFQAIMSLVHDIVRDCVIPRLKPKGKSK